MIYQAKATYPAQSINKHALTTALEDDFFGLGVDLGLYDIEQKTGKSRYELLDIILADDEVDACREDILSALIAKPYRFYAKANPHQGNAQGGMDEQTINWLYDMFAPLLPIFAQLALIAKWNGHAIAEYVYAKDGSRYRLDRVIIKDMGGFTFQKDDVLCVVDGKLVRVDDKLKMLILKNRATPSCPMGEMMAIKAYSAVLLRQKALAYASQFVARYAQPYLIGKSTSDVANTIFNLAGGGAAQIGLQDSIEIHQLTADGVAFEKIEQLCNRRIQKLLLGRVKISEMSYGSRAAVQTDDIVKDDRLNAYIRLMTSAVQHALDALVAVNNAYAVPMGAVWFEPIEQIGVDMNRAHRDAIYHQMGLVFTDEYYADVLGFEKKHFKSQSLALALSATSDDTPSDTLADGLGDKLGDKFADNLADKLGLAGIFDELIPSFAQGLDRAYHKGASGE